MNYQKLLLVLLFGIFVVSQSCEKKEIVDVENAKVENQIGDVEKNIQQAEQFIYYLDNKEVSKKIVDSYTNKHEEPFIIQTAKIDAETNKTINVIYAYTTEAGYIEYGENHNLKLKEGLIFEKHMKEYAKKSGAIEYFEKTGKILEAYSKYESEYHNKIFGKNRGKATLVEFSKEHNRKGSHVYMVQQFPTMPCCWNKKASCVVMIGAVGSVSIYRKFFYRKRIMTIVSWGQVINNLYGSADNATKSSVKHW